MMKTPDLSHCAQLVHRHDGDRFLLALFVPEPAREQLLALYALRVELAHIKRAAREEMLGHIRHAWWSEALEALAEGKGPRGHPVLSELERSPLSAAELAPLSDAYREAFPDMPVVDELMDALSLTLLERACPQAIAHWKKAHGVIARHRKKWGQGGNSWLRVKLLLAGIF